QLIKKCNFGSSLLDLHINSSKQTLLHIAAKFGSGKVVKALIEGKASVHVQDMRQDTPLHLACEKLPKSQEAVLAIIHAGASRYIQNNKKQTPGSFVPSKLRAWFRKAAPLTPEEKKQVGGGMNSFANKGLDIALIRQKLSQADRIQHGLLPYKEVLNILIQGGMDKKAAERNVKDYLGSHSKEKKDRIKWKDFISDFVTMKLVQCVMLLGNAKIFGKIDVDNTQTLTLKEFSKHIDGQIGKEEGMRHAKKLFHKIDTNRDGRISKFELKLWYRQRLKAVNEGKT
ncbi:hypothetical protein AAMO2058_001566600, partial [Amorphochlora amoebiformis]